MERVGQTLGQGRLTSHLSTEEIIQKILADSDVATFIAKEGLDQLAIKRSLPKFNQYLIEREKFLTQDQTYLAKGYQPILAMNEGYADVSYLETAELKYRQQERDVLSRIRLLNLPKSYRQVTIEDIALDDLKRIPVFDALVDFVNHYPQGQSKGIYLYGDMGLGKSFMMAAFAHELSKKKEVSTTLVHFPSFAIDIKQAIKTGEVKEEIDRLKLAPVLVLDDIGAEQTSSWLRDEVLQVILQYRMQEELPTFFTSNYSLADLEKKMAQVKDNDEAWPAKRVMERIRYLAREIHLVGENRR
ncbi:primosomal protein DnaI [Streptococcus cuniculipharyngis]|uniref:Primosomal protein DnaI n=1 Tax=Streptococcus cuniculipharyngis TaxID=1562651 RepID=A0A5C5SC54_9STRE|nr:primosomal protein DnaI [Streptococcus cuniculipharyngis]TWS98154.1 primosomal protein DnaI [Streptococcus cuniculipharyngis]